MAWCQVFLLDTMREQTGLCSKGGTSTEQVEKHVEGALLLACYGTLLTDAQRELMALYYNEDLSLQEIADNQGISRQGVHDILTRSVKKLESYEARLHLLERGERRLEQLNDCLVFAQDCRDTEAKNKLTSVLERMIQEEEQP